MKDYLEINKKSWNTRLDAHLQSDFYDLKGFIDGRSSLNKIELDILGDLKGKSILHLQCHFGQDSISLSRMGANVVGVDLSDKSIEKAKELAITTQSNARFICSDVYQLPEVLNEKFDIVFTTYGTISWLPDLDKWAQVISHFLKAEGQFVFAEFHPVVWMFDDDVKEITFPYNNMGAMTEEEEGTYANKDAPIKEKCVFWNHSMAEVVNSLIANKIAIDALHEYCYSPYPFVKNCEEYETGKFRIKHFENKIPLVYAINGRKN